MCLSLIFFSPLLPISDCLCHKAIKDQSSLTLPIRPGGLSHPQTVNCQSNQQKNETSVKWINPSEISAMILILLDESDERVIIVSPYMKISKWHRNFQEFAAKL
jgi:hypothetical protein